MELEATPPESREKFVQKGCATAKTLAHRQKVLRKLYLEWNPEGLGEDDVSGDPPLSDF